MIFISPTCILTGREALAGREGRAGWVDRKIRANEKNVQNKTKRLKLMKRACQMCSVVMDAFGVEKGIKINENRALEYPPPMRRI